MPKSSETDKFIKPWERQKGESSQAFEAFSSYRDLGAERSTSKVQQKLGKNLRLIQRWSSQWNWVERTRAYDNDLDRVSKKLTEKAIKSMSDRHIKLAMQVQAKAIAALGELETENMSAKDIKEFIKMATELERICRITLVKLLESSEDKDTHDNSSLTDMIIEAYEKRKMDENSNP